MTTAHSQILGGPGALVARTAVIALALLMGASCGNGGSVPEPTGSRSGSNTRLTSPTSERPAPTRTETVPTRTEAAPSRTEAVPTRTEAAPTRTEAAPSNPGASTTPPGEDSAGNPGPSVVTTPQPSPNPSSATGSAPGERSTIIVKGSPQPTPAPASAAPPSQAAEPSTATETDTSGVPSWLWWLIGAVAIAGAIAAPYLVHRRRQAWQTAFAAAVEEAVWLARVLIPQLQMYRSSDEVRGGWIVSADRVTTCEDGLTALEATAHSEEDRTRARTLRDVVRASRERIEAVAGGEVTDLFPELGRVASDLEIALAAVSPSTAATAPSRPG